MHQLRSQDRFSVRPHKECCDRWSFLHRSRRTPEGASVEPFRVSTQHLVVELFCCRGLSGEFLKIKNVPPGLSDDPWAVVIGFRVLVAGYDDAWLERLHFAQRGEPFSTFFILVCFHESRMHAVIGGIPGSNELKGWYVQARRPY